MKTCIYSRTCKQERPYNTTSIDNQIAFARDVAQRYNLTVEREYIFTDIEKGGELMPTCWADEGAPSRPALSEMIFAIEEGGISHVIVRRIDKLGSSSEVLTALRDFLLHYQITIVVPPELFEEARDPRTEFAISTLRACIQVQTDVDREHNAKVRAKKEEELRRLQDRVTRLEAEIAELSQQA